MECTALTTAIENSDYEHFIQLIKSGEDVNVGGNHHNINGYPVYAAVNNDDPRYLTVLLEHKVNYTLSTCCCADSYTMMHFAAKNNKPRSIELLANAGADVNALSAYNVTPLMGAAKENNSECIRTLIKLGADMNITSNEITRELESYIPENMDTCLTFAIYERSMDAIKILINECDFDFNTYQTNISKILLEQFDKEIFKMFIHKLDTLSLLDAVAEQDNVKAFKLMLKQKVLDNEDLFCEKYDYSEYKHKMGIVKILIKYNAAADCFIKYLDGETDSEMEKQMILKGYKSGKAEIINELVDNQYRVSVY